MPLQADIDAARLCGDAACTAAAGLSADKGALVPAASGDDASEAPPPAASPVAPAKEDGLFDGLDNETQAILHARIAPTTRGNYFSMLVRLFRYFQDNNKLFPGVLSHALLEELQKADLQDSEKRTRSGAPSKRRDASKRVIVDAIKSINSQDPLTFPINFDNFTFNCFAGFLKTFKKTIVKRSPKTPSAAQKEVTTVVTSTVTIRLGAGSFSAACSALAFIFTECGVEKDGTPASRQLWKQIALYMKGTRRTGARERQALGLRIIEGKDPMPFAAYVKLASILACSQDTEHVAAHLFLLLDWNMVSRAENAVNSHIDLFGIFDDALLVYLGPSKGDQEGTKHIDHPWHLYTVPENPAICPVLAFAKYLMCHPQILNGKCKIFDGSSQYERMNAVLKEVVRSDDHYEEFSKLGLQPEYFGTHSIRKGSITHGACGVVNGPPIASICIRANWKMPGVMNRYMRYESAGDEYVGRSVCGRVRLGKRFAESCPYFDFSNCGESEKEERHKKIDDWIQCRMPELCSTETFRLFKFCVATFIFHRDWLDENIHEDNALRFSPFWSEPIPFASCVVTRFPWDKTQDTPQFTGLPTDVLYMTQVEKLKTEVDELLKSFDMLRTALLADNSRVVMEVCEKMIAELDLRSVGGEGYGLSREIDQKIDLLISRLDTPREVVHCPNTQVPHDEEGDPYFFKTCDVDEEVVITFEECLTAAQQESAQKSRVAETRRQLKRRKLTVGFHHGKLNVLPASWKYPKMNLVQLIHLYQMGSPSEGITALRLCKSSDVNHFDKEGRNLSRMRRVMMVVQHFARMRGVWKPLTAGSDYWDGETVTRVWDGVWKDLLPLLRTCTTYDDEREDSWHKSRVGDISWRTCHNKFLDGGVFKSLSV